MKYFLLLLSLFGITVCGTEFVTYEAFGAKGDGKQNDGPAIAKAHRYANAQKLPVKAADDRTYYIGKMESPAIIQTDTDWGKAHFVIDDRNVFSERTKPVFWVTPSRPSFKIKPPASLKRGTDSIGVKVGCPALIRLMNSRTRHFIRKGLNQDNGVPQQEVLLVDQNGKIDPATPLLWDYSAVTSMEVYPLEEKTLSIRGGNFTTIANAAPSKYTYFQRNIKITRSNVKLSGIRHTVTGEGETGAPYDSFVLVSLCAYVTIEDSFFSGHKTYTTIGSAGKPVPMGTYDLGAKRSCFITWRNCRQINSIHDRSLWGIFGSNYCRRLCLEKCVFSRFDSHKGAADVILRDCEIGYQGVQATGFGTLLMENCHVFESQLIMLRSDYGSFWRGNFVIRNSTLHARGRGYLISYENDGTHDFGYPCMMPQTITLENFKFDNTKSNQAAYLFQGFTEPVPGAKYPYQVTGKCVLQNVTAANGKPIQISNVSSLFKKCTITKK